jgi:hypothetical protein
MLRARSFLASVYGLMPKSAHSRGFAAPSQKKRRRFIDSVFLSAQGGKGGDGCASFRQERGSRRKFPDGGDGGNGGNIVFVASHGRKSLNFETINVKGGAADNGGRKSCVCAFVCVRSVMRGDPVCCGWQNMGRERVLRGNDEYLHVSQKQGAMVTVVPSC